MIANHEMDSGKPHVWAPCPNHEELRMVRATAVSAVEAAALLGTSGASFHGFDIQAARLSSRSHTDPSMLTKAAAEMATLYQRYGIGGTPGEE